MAASSGILRPRKDIRVKAEAGLFNTKTRVLTLKGQGGDDAATCWLQPAEGHLLPAERVLIAPEHVVITEPGLKVEGRGAAGGTGRQAGYEPNTIAPNCRLRIGGQK